MKLTDQVAVVTGGGGGLGESICRELAVEGADIVVSDINAELAQKVSASITTTGRRSMGIGTDVQSFEQCRALMDQALESFGKIDIVVCCAGVHAVTFGEEAAGSPGLIENITEPDWNMTVNVNLRGVFFCNRAIAPYFKQQKKGKIVNIASVGGRGGSPIMPHYSASKAGVINLSQSVALQLAPFNVNVNTVCPGMIYTPMWETGGYPLMASLVPKYKEMTAQEVFDDLIQTRIPLGRPQTGESIAKAVLFFASADADEITGQALNVDGGAILS